MKNIILIFLLLLSCPTFAHELILEENTEGAFIINGNKCSFLDLKNCEEHLASLTLEELLVLTENALSFINSQYKFDAPRDQYYHYLATIHAAAFYSFFSSSFSHFAFGFEPLYESLEMEYLVRSDVWVQEILNSIWNKGIRKKNKYISMKLGQSKYYGLFNNEFALYPGLYFFARMQREKAVEMRSNGAYVQIAQFITDECDKRQLIGLLTFDLPRMWMNIHDEMMEHLNRGNIEPPWEVIDLPQRVRRNKYVKPFIHQFTNQETLIRNIIKEQNESTKA